MWRYVSLCVALVLACAYVCWVLKLCSASLRRWKMISSLAICLQSVADVRPVSPGVFLRTVLMVKA